MENKLRNSSAFLEQRFISCKKKNQGEKQVWNAVEAFQVCANIVL